ncbi:hypothetical protein HanHA300_Chr10g0372401 [Helianthus annuus]|nr:hypothetical protein HanHA300_Chr10g0372401 [Helianthus annuus]
MMVKVNVSFDKAKAKPVPRLPTTQLIQLNGIHRLANTDAITALFQLQLLQPTSSSTQDTWFVTCYNRASTSPFSYPLLLVLKKIAHCVASIIMP